MGNKVKQLNDILGFDQDEMEAELLNYWMQYCYRWVKNPLAYQLMLANTVVNNWYNDGVNKQTCKFLKHVYKMDADGVKVSYHSLRELYIDYLEIVWDKCPYLPGILKAYPKKTIYDQELKMYVFDQLNMN